jgi:hypothetical protein
MKTRNATTLAAVTLCGCTASTMIESTWTDPTFSRVPFEQLGVVALFDTTAESRSFEQSAARELEQRGIEAVPAYTILGDERMYEQDELRSELAAADIDGILIYRMIAVDERNVYRNPTPYMRVPNAVLFGDPYYWYYYPRWDYYWYWRSTWDVTHSPEYWEPVTYVIVETSLFDTRTDRLVWTAKSATMDGGQFDALAESIAESVTDELVAMELLTPSESERTAAAR